MEFHAYSGGVNNARQALEESAALQRALFDSALDSIICTDREARIIEFNAAAERTFRVSRSVALGKDLADVTLPPALRDH